MFLYLLIFQKLKIIGKLISKYKVVRMFVVILVSLLSIYTLEIVAASTSFAIGRDSVEEYEAKNNKMIAEESKKFLSEFYKPVFEKEIDVNKLSPDSIKQLFSELLNLCPTSPPIKEKVEISSKFGYRKLPSPEFHKGIDIRAVYGQKVYSTMSGTVTEIGYEDSYSHGYGNYILMKNEIGFETRYAHLQKISVKKGQNVQKNQLLGTVGLTGNSTGVNLHYEVIQGNDAKDPQKFILMDIKNVFKNNNDAIGSQVTKEDQLIPKKSTN